MDIETIQIIKLKENLKRLKLELKMDCFEDLEKWIEKIEISINIYSFGAYYILKCKKVAYNRIRANGRCNMVCNNNHSLKFKWGKSKRIKQ